MMNRKFGLRPFPAFADARGAGAARASGGWPSARSVAAVVAR
jgi:hypothetical protein